MGTKSAISESVGDTYDVSKWHLWKLHTYSGTTCLICGFTYPSTALAVKQTSRGRERENDSSVQVSIRPFTTEFTLKQWYQISPCKQEVAYRAAGCNIWRKLHPWVCRGRGTGDDWDRWCGQPESEWRSLWLCRAWGSRPFSHLGKHTAQCQQWQ